MRHNRRGFLGTLGAGVAAATAGLLGIRPPPTTTPNKRLGLPETPYGMPIEVVDSLPTPTYNGGYLFCRLKASEPIPIGSFVELTPNREGYVRCLRSGPWVGTNLESSEAEGPALFIMR